MIEAKEMARKAVLHGVRRQQIIQLAERISGSYLGTDFRAEPKVIADEHGVTISHDDYGDHFDGLLHFDEGRFHIFCNAHRCGSIDGSRARFTLAHELGHFFIPEHHRALRSGATPSHPSFCSNPNATSLVEQEADLFASRLLMPEEAFRKATGLRGFSLSGVRAVANDFGTSLQASFLRCLDSEILPCAVIWWRKGRKPWFGTAQMLKRKGLVLKQPSAENACDGSATHKALKGNPGDIPDCFSTPTLAHAWFHGVIAGSAQDVLFREESLITVYGTATWLTADEKDIGRLPSLLDSPEGHEPVSEPQPSA